MFIRAFSVSLIFAALMIALDVHTVGLPSFFWNLVFLLLCLLSALLMFNRFWFSSFLTSVAFLALVVADKAKFYYMDDHLRWSDMANITRNFGSISGLQQFISLMGNYVADAGRLRVSLLAIALVVIVGAFYKLERPFWRFNTRLDRPLMRVPFGVGAAALTLVLAPFTANALLPYAHLERLVAANYQAIGMPMFFFASKQTEARIPDYSPQQAEAAHRFLSQLNGDAIEYKPAVAKPDIIVWFNESTFNPADFSRSKLTTGEWSGHVASMFVPDRNTVQFGSLAVGIFGGKSWNTVFALQAGAHVEWFSDDTYAASTLAESVDTTFFRTLKKHGYAVDAMYAQDGYLFDAAKSQLDYGADQFYGSDFVNPRDITIGRATDMELVEALQRLLQKPAKKPRAYFVFTMANHGPYPAADFSLDERAKERWGDLPLGVIDYLTRLERTNEAIETLSKFVEHSERPTILVHLGDHKPRIPGVEFDESIKYSTYYHIRTNFKTANQTPSRREDTDIMFISSRILELAGISGDLLFKANRTLANECRPGPRDCSERGNDILRNYLILVSENLRATP